MLIVRRELTNYVYVWYALQLVGAVTSLASLHHAMQCKFGNYDAWPDVCSSLIHHWFNCLFCHVNLAILILHCTYGGRRCYASKLLSRVHIVYPRFQMCAARHENIAMKIRRALNQTEKSKQCPCMTLQLWKRVKPLTCWMWLQLRARIQVAQLHKFDYICWRAAKRFGPPV